MYFEGEFRVREIICKYIVHPEQNSSRQTYHTSWFHHNLSLQIPFPPNRTNSKKPHIHHFCTSFNHKHFFRKFPNSQNTYLYSHNKSKQFPIKHEGKINKNRKNKGDFIHRSLALVLIWLLTKSLLNCEFPWRSREIDIFRDYDFC